MNALDTSWLKRFRAGITLLVFLTSAALSARQEGPDSPARSIVVSGSRGGVTVQRVLDNATTWLLLHHGYREHDETGRLSQIRNMEGARMLVRGLDDARRTLELGATPHASGGWELHAYGFEHRGADTTANPDLSAVDSKLRSLLDLSTASPLVTRQPPPADYTPAQPPPPSPGTVSTPTPTGAVFAFDLDRIAFETVHLRYAQSDRVLGLLKALGYATIEFVAQMGATDFEAVYAPLIHGEARLPLVVKIIEATKTSIMDPVPPAPGPPRPVASASRGQAAVPDIGGRRLHQTTTGEALQRLLIVHDPERPEALAKLRRLLREQIDVASRQIVLEALVIEIDSERMRDLGVSFDWQKGKSGASFGTDAGGKPLPFTYTFDRTADLLSQFKASLHALVSQGHAEILTNPSVLVLDGRQARIQIGQQIPVVSSTATNTAVSQRVEYFPVGIVLNIRPRLDPSSGEVTMQVETIVSSVSSTGGAATTVGDDVFFAPAIDNRQVQTFVRIADNTPFIIGGLIASEARESTSGVPGLSKIPGLGALFRRKSKRRVKQEVIIVLTPHVVPNGEKSFGYAVPKESSAFDSFDNQLFRNAYRLRSQDIFDLSFLHQSPDLQRLDAAIREHTRHDPALAAAEPLAGILAGHIPGEAIMVRRMLWEVVGEHEFESLVNPDHIIFFEPQASGGFEVAFLRDYLTAGPSARKATHDEALVVAFNRRIDGSAYAEPRWQAMPTGGYTELLRGGNPLPPANSPAGSSADLATLVLGDRPGSVSTLDVLRRVLVLERVLELNPSLDLRLDALYVGLQIVFPSEEDLTQRFHLIDRETAQLFFEVEEYYAAFERELDRGMARAFELVAPAPQASPQR